LPLFLLWRAGIPPDRLAWLLVLPLLSSAYFYSQVDAKTPDGFFLGFPSYWNIVAFYLYVLHPPVRVSTAMIVTLSVLTFVPTPYLYATRGGPFARLINVGAAIWFVLIGLILYRPEHHRSPLALASLTYPPALALLVRRELRRASPTHLTYATYPTHRTYPPSLALLVRRELQRASPTHLTYLTYTTHLTYATYPTYPTQPTYPPSLAL